MSQPTTTLQNEPATIWIYDTPLETAQTRANFCRYVLLKSSGRIILALHPIPSELLRELTREERVDLANTNNRAIRAIKPNTPQAAFAFTLEESIKRLDVNKKKAVEEACAKSLMTVKDGRVKLAKAVEKENVDFRKASNTGTEKITKKTDVGPQNTEVLERLKKTGSSNSAPTSRKDDVLVQATASLSLGRRVHFSVEVETRKYDKNSTPTSEWAAALGMASDGFPTSPDSDTARTTANRIASLDELEEELIILQCSLPDSTQTNDFNDFNGLGESMDAIKKAQDAIIATMDSEPLDAKLVAVAVEATDRAHTVQEFTLKRVNDPTYDSEYTRPPYVR